MCSNFVFTEEKSYQHIKKIQFKIYIRCRVKIIILDICGIERTVIVNKELKPGSYEIKWFASLIPSGEYFCRIEAGEHSEQKKTEIFNCLNTARMISCDKVTLTWKGESEIIF